MCVRLHLEAPSFLSASKEKERPESARGVRVLFRFNSKFRRVLNLFTYVNKKSILWHLPLDALAISLATFFYQHISPLAQITDFYTYKMNVTCRFIFPSNAVFEGKMLIE